MTSLDKIPIAGTTTERYAYFFLTQSEQVLHRMSMDLSRYDEAEQDTASFLSTLENIRNHIATHEEGITRDETIAEQMTNLLICKLASEQHERDVFNRGGPAEEVAQRVRTYFEDEVRAKYEGVLPDEGKLRLSDETLKYIVSQMHFIRISGLETDVLSELFQFFITPVLKGSQGQFFTPTNTIDLMIHLVDPQPDEKVIDPACGTGGFLSKAASRAQSGQASLERFTDPEGSYHGIDKDEFLSQLSRARAILSGNNPENIYLENSLNPPNKWNAETQKDVELGSFDVVLTNPPFGQGQKVKDDEILEQFELARKWKKDGNGGWKKTNRTVNTSLQVLFIERCLQLLKEGGRLGIVLPESLFGNPSYRYVMQYLEENTRMESIIAMPEELFQPYTHAKTCVLIAEKDTLGENEDHHIFMAAPEWCGHDSRGNPTTREDSDGVVRLLDDLPLVEERYDSLVEEGDDPVQDHFGFLTHSSKIDNKIYVPRYYAPDFEDSFESLSETHNMVKFGELLDEGLISMSTGVEVGKMAYGTGDIPFIRTSDMANWETKINPQHCVSKEIYEEYNEKAEVQAQDILLVKDGTSLIGTTCMISDYDTKMLYQSHIYKIRVEDRGELSPYELFAAFNHPVVTEQIKARQFTQQIIDSLSKERLREVVLPIPSEEETRQEVISKIRNIVETRAELKQEARMVLNGEI